MARVLVLAAGRRRYVVEELLRAKGPDDSLLVADAHPLTPGLSVHGVTALEEPTSPAQADEWLLRMCERLEVSAVLSLHDYQLARVSRLRESLGNQGCLWVGPSEDAANVLLDKKSFNDRLLEGHPELAIPTFALHDFTPREADLWVVKERTGSGSSGLQLGLSGAQASRALENTALVAQPLLAGEEWNLDYFVWPGGAVAGLSAKRKLRMRGGETDAAEVVPATDLAIDFSPVITALSDFEHVGNMDVDVMVGADGIHVLDVNPRFGGGYAFSIHAGYKAADALWRLVKGCEGPIAVEARRRFTGAKSIQVVPL